MEAIAPDLAVIVLAVGPSPYLGEAVASVVGQDGVAEIVIVASSAAASADLNGECVRFIRVGPSVTPGAARNAGIAATKASVVAFLAADCIAAPGWVGARLASHNAGAAAIGSALIPDRAASPLAWAAHIARFYRRLPGAPAEHALPYGASYSRELFRRHGLFREDLRTGEDTEFNRRLPAGDRPAWTPEVVTLHRSPNRFLPFLRDQRDRGARYWAAQHELAGRSRGKMFVGTLARTPQTVWRGLSWAEPKDRRAVLLAAPLIVLANVAFAFGVLAGRRN